MPDVWGIPQPFLLHVLFGKFHDDARFEILLTEQDCRFVLKVQPAFAVSEILYLFRAQQCHSLITPAHMASTVSRACNALGEKWCVNEDEMICRTIIASEVDQLVLGDWSF